MIKLMKYELRKTWFTKLILLGITAVAEIIYLVGLYTDREGTMSAGITLLFVLAISGLLVIGLESVLVLHRDMNTKQGYMLFMTPNSCYKILGAKVLECGISILLTGAFFFALGLLDLSLLFARQGMLNTLWQQIQSFLSSLTIYGRPLVINVSTISALCFSILTGWISTITTAYLADVISSSLLNGRKFNGLISFLLFVALSWGFSELNTLVTHGITDTVTMLWIYGVFELVIATVMYFVTAHLMDKYLSV